jgi:hypothetical protein
MELNKYNRYSDAIGNLYKAAYYLTKGSVQLAVDFLKKAKKKIGNKLDPRLINFLNQPEDYLKDSSSKNYWAEKILDQYKKFRYR